MRGWINKIKNKKRTYLLFTAVILIFSVFAIVLYSYRDAYFLLILCVLLYNIYQFFKQYYGRIREIEVLTFQNRAAIENYEQIKNHLTQIDCLRHDMKNHFNALQTLLENNCQQDAIDYLKRYAEQTDLAFDTVYHDNLLINTVVRKLIYLADEQNIKVELDLRAEPFNISAPDLFNLLSNVIDNALEACLSVPEDINRFIRLTISRREPYLNIVCENSRIGELSIDNGQFQSVKKDNEHGYGLKTIRRITDYYAGIMDTDYTENTFIIMIALKDQ